jgi:Flp pilus assembly protein TadD
MTRIVSVIVGGALIASTCLLTAATPQHGAPRTAARSTEPNGDNGTASAIRQFEQRVREVPRDYLSYAILGQLHARSARQTGNFDEYARAEQAFRDALAARSDHLPALLGLASALASQHRFSDALALAHQAQRLSPESVDALVVLGDASIEIGNYADAKSAYRELEIKAPEVPSMLARLAHLAQLQGKDAYALDLMTRAASREREEEGAGESAAWYEARVGHMLYRLGRLDDAGAHYEAALSLMDGYYIALDGLADVRAAQGRDAEAVSLLERAVTAVPQPGPLVALGDLYARHGRGADAERVYDQAEAIARRPGSYLSAYGRELALFYADHGRRLHEAQRLAEQDLANRPDIYGHDALAWALFKNRRLDHAWREITEALALGTRDASLWMHAGLIADARGDRKEARRFLSQAQALAPYLLNDDARRALIHLSDEAPAASDSR